MEPPAVCRRIGPGGARIVGVRRRNFWWPPFEAKQLYGMQGIIDLLYAKGLIARTGGAIRMTRAFLTSFIKK